LEGYGGKRGTETSGGTLPVASRHGEAGKKTLEGVARMLRGRKKDGGVGSRKRKNP